MGKQIRVWGVSAVAGTAPTAAAGLLAHAAVGQWRAAAGPVPLRLDEAVTLLATSAALALCLWLTASTVFAVLAHLPGRVGQLAARVARAVAPAVARRLAAVLVGAAVGGSLVPGAALASEDAHLVTARHLGAAAAVGQGPGFVVTPPPHAVERPGPGWTPTRATVSSPPSPELLTASPRATDGSAVVVHRGDTLWALVRRHLGPGASEAEVALAWPQWHAANRATIGDDPDLLLPGQVLRAPAPVLPASLADPTTPGPTPGPATGATTGPTGAAR
jgi:hypothetical protein